VVDQNIDDLLDADETKGNQTFLALYFLAEEDDRKLYLYRRHCCRASERRLLPFFEEGL
jgi:hypothetical protein